MAKVTRNGKTLTTRVWGLLDDARSHAELPPGTAYVMQGSWSGATASAGTHTGGGAFDLSVRGLTEKQQLRLIWHLRRRNVCAWIRSPKYGWPSRLGGPHIHGIVRDEPGLSSSARAQVVKYDRKQNGLAQNNPDPHKRPKQYPVEEVRLMAWPVGKSKMIKVPAGKSVTVKGGKWRSLVWDGKRGFNLEKGGRYIVKVQMRVPKRVSVEKPAEFRIARMGWGKAGPGQIDDTGQNPIHPRTEAQSWRTIVEHNMAGGGPIEIQAYFPPGDNTLRYVFSVWRVQ
jgi:hypothetical protein